MTGEHSPEKAAMFAVRAKMNHEVVLYFSLFIASVLAASILVKFLQIFRPWVPARMLQSLSTLPRYTRSLALQKVSGLPSAGHGAVISLYAVANLVATFAHYDLKNMPLLPNLASRTAWLAIVNMCVVVFLSLKNTPLAFLISWSYERLNPLHQVAGYATLIHVILHTSCYCAYFVGAGRASRLLYPEEIYGMVAGLSFVALGISGAIVRRWWYELFYYLHITFWILGIVMVGLHQPEWSKYILFATCACAGIWALDRLLRLARLAAYSVSNSVTVHPLPNNATRVVLKKAPLGARSGKHCFLWIPKIRTSETHPFTIASSDPVEFVIASYDGFTRDLHRYATENPGATLKASVDGAYGAFPTPRHADKTVLVAGGSGASFAFGAALDALENSARSKPDTSSEGEIIFIWMVKNYSQLTWYSKQLRDLRSHSRVSIRLYVTRPPVEMVMTVGDRREPSSPASYEKSKASARQGGLSSETEKDLSDLENQITSDPTVSECEAVLPSPLEGMERSIEGIAVHYLRPDVEVFIRGVIGESRPDQRVLVLGCGPSRLMKAVRNTTANCISGEGPAVELHCEQFGW